MSVNVRVLHRSIANRGAPGGETVPELLVLSTLSGCVGVGVLVLIFVIGENSDVACHRILSHTLCLGHVARVEVIKVKCGILTVGCKVAVENTFEESSIITMVTIGIRAVNRKFNNTTYCDSIVLALLFPAYMSRISWSFLSTTFQ